MKKDRPINVYLLLVLWSLLLTPSLPTPAGLPGLRADDLLLIFAPLFVVGFYSRIVLDYRVIAIFWVGVFIQIGILTGAILGYPASILDHFYLFRLAKYCGAVVVGSVFLYSHESALDALESLSKKIMPPGLILLIVVIQQYFNVGGLNASYVEFVAPTKYETLIAGSSMPRPVGLVGNPNELGFLLGILSLMAAYRVFRRKRASVWLLLCLVFVVGTALTLSRSALFATVGALALFVGSHVLNGVKVRTERISIQRNAAVWGSTILVVFMLSLYAFYSISFFYENVVWRFSPENYSSFYTRIRNWNEHIEMWMTSPIFGLGTLRHSDYFEHATDNEWLLLARIGGIALLGAVIVLFSLGIFKSGVKCDNIYFSRALIFGAMLYMIPATFFYSTVIFPLALILLAVSTPCPWKIINVRQSTGSLGSLTEVRRANR